MIFMVVAAPLAFGTLLWTAVADAQPEIYCLGLEQEGELARISGTVKRAYAGNEPRDSVGVPDNVANDYTFDEENAARFCVTIETEGVYVINASVFAPDQQSDSFWVQVDDRSPDLWHTDSVNRWTADYVASAATADPVRYELEAGDHYLTFFARESGTRLDRFALERVGSTRPAPAARCDGARQDAGDAAANGTVLRGTTDGLVSVGAPSGAGSNQVIDPVSYAEFCLEVDEDGPFRLETTTIAPSARHDSWWVQVNDMQPLLWHVTNSETWSNSAIATAGSDRPATFPLTAGDNTVRFFHREDGTFLHDVTAVAASEPPAPEPTRPPTPPTPTATPPAPTATPTATPPAPTATPTATPPAPTATPTATATPVPPTATATATPVPPTATATATPAPPIPSDAAAPAYLGTGECINAVARVPMLIDFSQAFAAEDGIAISYAISGADLPAGATIDRATGLLTANAPSGSPSYNFNVVASVGERETAASVCVDVTATPTGPVFTGVPIRCGIVANGQPVNLDLSLQFQSASGEVPLFFIGDVDGLRFRDLRLNPLSGALVAPALDDAEVITFSALAVDSANQAGERSFCLVGSSSAPLLIQIDCLAVVAAPEGSVELTLSDYFVDLGGDPVRYTLRNPSQAGEIIGDTLVVAPRDFPSNGTLTTRIIADNGVRSATWSLCLQVTLQAGPDRVNGSQSSGRSGDGASGGD